MRRAVLVTVALLLAGCGESDLADERSLFADDVAEVRDAVDAGDRDAALTELAELAERGRAAHAEGELSDLERVAFEDLYARAVELVEQELPPEPAPAPEPEPDPESKQDREKRKDRDDDEDDDD